MERNYNTVALFYDQLSRLVFGQALTDAQQYLLTAVPAGARVLMVGGGTGLALEQLCLLHPTGLTITYIDASEKMTALARRRNTGRNEVAFYAQRIQDAAPGMYDVVLTPFLFDNFRQQAAADIFNTISRQLAPGGLWLYADFNRTHILWQRAVLWIMYIFFRLLCGIEAAALPDMDALFTPQHYKLQQEKQYINGFVSARIYCKLQ